MTPSKLFMRYIEKFPESKIAKEYAEQGDAYFRNCGHFALYLACGSFEWALSRADDTNTECLKQLIGNDIDFDMRVREFERVYNKEPITVLERKYGIPSLFTKEFLSRNITLD